MIRFFYIPIAFGGGSPFRGEVEEGDTDEQTLERIFAGCNAGSGQEFEGFLRSRMRSLSVGDDVVFNGKRWKCEPFGWKQVYNEG